MAKVIIYLRDNESAALKDLAQREYRAPKAQAALIIRNELERLGMIQTEHGQAMPAADATVRSETECAS
jgi:hypothetical protein